MRNFLTLEAFRELAKEQKTGSDTAIRILSNAEVKAGDDDKRELQFTISTDTIDRAGDKINQSGWQLDNYLKNPVMLWAHDYSKPPIGKSDGMKIEGGKLKSNTMFVPASNPAIGRFAEGIYQLYKGGFMSAVSVGFLPKKWAFVDDSTRKYGIDFEEMELLEFSAVPVPANPDAILEARSMADVVPVIEWALETIFPKGINRRKLEGILCDAGYSRKQARLLCALSPDGLTQCDADEIQSVIDSMKMFRETLK